MLKKAAVITGILFVAAGILGFVPGITTDGHLLGVFRVDALHNLVHIASGVVAFIVGRTSEYASRRYFQIFGVVYGLVAVLGFFYLDQPLLGIMAHNTADLVLHIAIAAASLYLGFMYTERRGALA